MRLSDRELLLVLATCVLTLLFARDAPIRAHRLIAQVAAKGGALETAEQHRRVSIELAERATAVRERAHDHAALAHLHRRAGRFAEADRELRRALVLLGPEERTHPEARLRIRSELIGLSLASGMIRRAERDAAALLQFTERAFGNDSLAVAQALETVTAVAVEGGSLDRAEEAARRALTIREAAHGPEDPAVARMTTALGAILRADGRAEQAALYLERSVAVLRRSQDPESPAWRRVGAALGVSAPSTRHLLPSLNELALAYRDTGRLDRAEDTLRSALDAAGPQAPTGERCAILVQLADVLRRRNPLDPSEQQAREALAVAAAGDPCPVLSAALQHGRADS